MSLARFSPWILIALLAGCAAQPAVLTVHSAEHRAAYAQKFGPVYAGRTDDGTYEFLLVADDAAQAAARAKPGAPLVPVAQTPLRQVVHVKVLWRPLAGTDSTAANNATINWYVFSDAPGARDDLLVYRGTAFVAVTPHHQTVNVTLRNGTITPLAARGSLRDPVGTARLSGSFSAVVDEARLQEVLAATRTRIKSTDSATASVR